MLVCNYKLTVIDKTRQKLYGQTDSKKDKNM